MMYFSFITDLDGTLCDTLPANIAAYRDAFAKAGYEFDEVTYKRHFGHRFEEMMELVAPHISPPRKAEIAHYKVEAYKKYANLIVPNTNLINFLQAAKQKGVKIGIATTAKRVNAQNILQHLGLSDFFDATVFGEDVTHAKPHPECYLKAIEILGVKPDDCVIFEDTVIGIEAATHAGAHTIKIIV